MSRDYMCIIDQRMNRHSDRLVRELKAKDSWTESLATTIFDELTIAHNDIEGTLAAIRDSSPMDIQRRRLFFESYNVWDVAIRGTEKVSSPLPGPIVQRAYREMQWVVHLYCSFVFAGDGLFEVLKKKGPEGSCIRKCSGFIRENPVRALRHAVAHGNWQAEPPDFDSVTYWAKKGGLKDEPIVRFNASLEDLQFYLDLTWATAWASLLAVTESIRADDGAGPV